MTNHLGWLNNELTSLEDQGLLRRKRRVVNLGEGWCQIDGKKLRNFASNDYLNLASDSRLIDAAGKALSDSGVGSTASAMVTGRTQYHQQLESRLADFEGEEAAILFPTGFAANVGSIAALVEDGDVVFCDRLNHASLIDGCRLSTARFRVFRHQDLETLKRELEKSQAFRRRLIVTDSLFSMDGVAAPLSEMCEFSLRYNAMILVDEAHATGIFGDSGRGLAQKFEVENRVSVRIGTLSKALGCLGGFVCGSRQLVDWLWNNARSQMFSTALPPSVCAAAIAAVDIIEQEPQRRVHLQVLSEKLRAMLPEVGVPMLPGGMGPIVPVLLNDPRQAVKVANRLEERGLLVAAIRPPTVPKGTSRLRITVTCAHSEDDVDTLVSELASILHSLS